MAIVFIILGLRRSNCICAKLTLTSVIHQAASGTLFNFSRQFVQDVLFWYHLHTLQHVLEPWEPSWPSSETTSTCTNFRYTSTSISHNVVYQYTSHSDLPDKRDMYYIFHVPHICFNGIFLHVSTNGYRLSQLVCLNIVTRITNWSHVRSYERRYMITSFSSEDWYSRLLWLISCKDAEILGKAQHYHRLALSLLQYLFYALSNMRLKHVQWLIKFEVCWYYSRNRLHAVPF